MANYPTLLISYLHMIFRFLREVNGILFLCSKMSMQLDTNSLRNFREFLETYNKISETCFNRCVVNLHQRTLTNEELHCADICTERNVVVNHKVLQSFMVEQPRINEKKIAEAEKAAAAMAAASANQTEQADQ